MEQNKIPQISELNPEQLDYVARLDEGMNQLELVLDDCYERRKEFMSKGADDQIAYLRENGVTAELEKKVLAETEDETYFAKITTRAEALIVHNANKEENRAVEDLIDMYDELRNQEERKFNKELKDLSRAYEDYSEALHQLTEIKLLNEVNPLMFWAAHLYIIEGQDVYEAQIDLRNPEIVIGRSPNMKPEYFESEECLSNFSSVEDENVPSAYLISNPSTVIQAKDLVNSSFVKIAKTQLNALKEESKKESKKEKKKVPKKFFNKVRDSLLKFGMK